MVRNMLTLLFASVLASSLSMPVFAQEAPAKDSVAKGRCEGKVLRSSTDQSTLTVHDNSVRQDRPVRQLDEMGQSEARQQNGQRH